MTTKKAQEALSYFSQGLLCSQSILLTYGLQFGLESETAKKIARPFGTGMARQAEMCGAITGAYLVLGLSCTKEDNRAAKAETYGLVQTFTQRFRERNGSLNCRELLGCDLGTPAGQQQFNEHNLIRLCNGYVQDAAEILENILEEKFKAER